jgi:hypothetical protein
LHKDCEVPRIAHQHLHKPLANIMKHRALIISLILVVIFGSSAISSEYDSSFVAINSDNNNISDVNGYTLLSIQQPPCSYLDFKRKAQYGVISNVRKDDSHFVTVHFSEICCRNFIGEIYATKKRLELIFSKIGDECECYCNYKLTYQIKSDLELPDKILLNGKVQRHYNDAFKTYKESFKIVDGDTINYIDKYGLKQGAFVKFNSKNDTLDFNRYIDDDLVESRDYYSDGKRERLILLNYKIDPSTNRDSAVKVISWDEHGKLKSIDFLTFGEYLNIYSD